MRIANNGVLLAALAVLGLSACSRGTDLANNDARGLVEAIRAANASPGDDTIRLARRGLYVLTAEAAPGLLLPAIRGKLKIEGNGAEIRGYSAAQLALLEVARDGEVMLQDLSLAEGSNGAIRNFGELRLQSARVIDSTGSRISAIVLNHGELFAKDSEFAYNALDDSLRDAGTVLNYGKLRLDNSRIHDNRVQQARPGVGAAGAILNMGVVRMQATRMENNVAGEAGQPGFLSFDGVLNLGNGRVEGELPAGSTREAVEPLQVAAQL